MEKKIVESVINQKLNCKLPHKADFIENFKKTLVKSQLQELIQLQKHLSWLCLNFDPYEDTDQTDAGAHQLIERYELETFLGDPFEFTNNVLQMLDSLEHEINKRKQ